MYRIFVLFLLLQASMAWAEDSDAEKIRKAIDATCGDSWCEGDSHFKFKRVVLDTNANETQVAFTIGLKGWEPTLLDRGNFTAMMEQANYEVRCVIKGYSKASDILSGPYTLRWDFYEPLSECVRALEKRGQALSNPLYDDR